MIYKPVCFTSPTRPYFGIAHRAPSGDASTSFQGKEGSRHVSLFPSGKQRGPESPMVCDHSRDLMLHSLFCSQTRKH